MAKTQRAVALTIAGRTRLRTPPLSGTIFTFGCLLLASGPVRMAVLVVPVLWSAVGGSAASCWRCRRTGRSSPPARACPHWRRAWRLVAGRCVARPSARCLNRPEIAPLGGAHLRTFA